ncbi:hypothetical protein [Streptomyces sp. NPDC056491]|uniref:hypothetical protein n=1 Tax=Streptomyces sp. NPDC056491 TaxID=3345837 RepID=UPI0036B31E67
MKMDRTKAATYGLLVPAGMALGMSADTSARFLKTTLGISETWEQVLLCGVAEAAIVALTVYAWATRTKGPAYIAYAAVLVQMVPAFQVSGGTGGLVRAALGPVLLTLLLHLLLGLEVRMSGAHSDGLVQAALRELKERLTASLGIGRRGADSAAIARSRAADRAVNLADRVAAVESGTWRHRRRAAALAAAIDAARHGLDPAEGDRAESLIVDRVVRRKSVAGLATIEQRHNWSTGRNVPAEVPAVVPATRNQEVPAEVPSGSPEVPALAELALPEVPAQQVPAMAPVVPLVPAEPEQVPHFSAVPELMTAEAGTSAEVPSQVNPGSAFVPAEPQTPAAPSRGAATRAARELISAGTTDPARIRETLAASGIVPPSDRYLRRLVSEAHTERGTGAYM